MKMSGWHLFGILCGLASIGLGIQGITNRKRFKNPGYLIGYLIMSIGEIVFGAFVLVATLLFILKGIK